MCHRLKSNSQKISKSKKEAYQLRKTTISKTDNELIKLSEFSLYACIFRLMKCYFILQFLFVAFRTHSNELHSLNCNHNSFEVT